MPIKDPSLYPDDWRLISHRIRFERADSQCEWVEEDGTRCQARHWEPHPITGSLVVLTTAHLDHNPQNNEDSNLLAMCQLHHLRYDADQHAATAAATRRQRQLDAGQLMLDLDGA